MDNRVKYGSFLKDVFICSLGSYGGPEAHISVFLDQMVSKKNYLKEQELIELVALCSVLPGPTSTQTIVAIGYKKGGPLLALLTMLVWAFPVLVVMSVLSFLYQILAHYNISSAILKYIGPLAVGFIVTAAFKISKKVATDKLTMILLICSAIITYFIRAPWIFPLILVIGGFVSIFASKEKDIWNKVKINPPWIYFIAFASIALILIFLSIFTDNKLISLFEDFYRYGYLVFGGGQVVVPLMHTDLVEVNSYMTSDEFLTGYGVVQGLPGPMFSFSAYAAGMATRGNGILYQVIGCIIGGVGIFLPGTLLIYFIYPIWENLKNIKAIKISLKGINAVAGGMIAVAALILMKKSGFYIDNILVMLGTIILLSIKKIPAPLIVLAVIVFGIIVNK